ncbi:MAG: outer membrane protein transport protein [Planctomycetota bacterium]
MFFAVVYLTTLSLSAQQGAEVTGISAQEAGTAGAAISTGQSLLDASTNPATLLDLFGERSRHPGSRHRLEILARSVNTSTDITTTGGHELMIDQPGAVGPWLGYAASLGDDVAWSIVFQPTLAVDFSTTRLTELEIVTVNPDGSGGPATANIPIATELTQLALEPSIAWRATKALNFGLGLSIRNTNFKSTSAAEVALSDLKGSIPDGLSGIFGNLSWGELIAQLGEDRGVDAFQTTYSGEASSSTPSIYLKFGGTWQASRNTRVGFWYRPQSSATNLEGQVRVDLSDDLGTFVTGLEDILGVNLLDDPTSEYDFRLTSVAFPQQAGISMERWMTDRQRFQAKMVWTDWSQAFSDWTVRLSNPSNPEFIGYLGGDGSIDIDLGLKWRDSIAVSTGYEIDLHPRFTVRGGIGWSRNPVGGSVLPGVSPYNKMHVAAGASWWAGSDGIADWHLAVIAAIPEKWTAGTNTVLSDLSGDQYDQTVMSVLIAATFDW